VIEIYLTFLRVTLFRLQLCDIKGLAVLLQFVKLVVSVVGFY